MAYIFMDESGDLGFNFDKKGTSSYFLVTFLLVYNKRSIEKCVKKVYSTLRKKYKKVGILHAYKEEPITRKRLLALLANTDCRVMTILLNKRKVYTRLQDEKPVLYNYITNILLDRIFSKKLVGTESVEIVASKKETNKFLNQNFKIYLQSQLIKEHGISITITVKTAAEAKALQAADFVSWAIFRKYEHGDETYYDIIRRNIVEENPLFP